jgi:hypothetical protein
LYVYLSRLFECYRWHTPQAVSSSGNIENDAINTNQQEHMLGKT